MNASASRWAIPAVGSSSRSRRGAARMMEARSTTRRVPVESSAVRWWRKRSSPKAPMTSIDRRQLPLLGPSGPGQPQCRRHHGHLVLDVFAEHQDVEHRQLREEATVLERADDPDALAFLGKVLGQVRSIESHCAVVGRDQAGHHVECGGLPRPVGADQTDDGARLRREADLVDRPHPAEGHPEILDRQPGRTTAGPGSAHDSTTSGTGASGTGPVRPRLSGRRPAPAPRGDGPPSAPGRNVRPRCTTSAERWRSSPRPPGR